MNPINTRACSIPIVLLLLLNQPCNSRAGFEPLALTPESYKYDVVVEKTAPPPIVPVTTASMEQGIANLGFTWFERGYLREYPGIGLPEAGSILISEQSVEHLYRMPSSYQTNNAVLIDSVRTNATLRFTTATNY